MDDSQDFDSGGLDAVDKHPGKSGNDQLASTFDAPGSADPRILRYPQAGIQNPFLDAGRRTGAGLFQTLNDLLEFRSRSPRPNQPHGSSSRQPSSGQSGDESVMLDHVVRISLLYSFPNGVESAQLGRDE